MAEACKAVQTHLLNNLQFFMGHFKDFYLDTFEPLLEMIKVSAFQYFIRTKCLAVFGWPDDETYQAKLRNVTLSGF